MAIEHKESNDFSKTRAARQAIESRNKALLISLLNKTLLEEAVDSDGNTLLLFAIKANRLDFIQLLVEIGANFQAVNKHGLNALDIASIAERPAIITYFSQLMDLNKQLDANIIEVMTSVAAEKPTAGELSAYEKLKQGSYTAIARVAEQFLPEAKSMGVMEKVLLNTTVSGLFEAVASSEDYATLLNNLHGFFRQRETLLENTGVDYCFLPPQHICHVSCYEIAELLRNATEKEDIYDVLLSISKHERRPSHAEKWRNNLILENKLPQNPNEFVRWHGEIHVWEQILGQAVSNMADSERSLDRIWLKTDNKQAQRVDDVKPGPLPEALLSVLQQKGDACRDLVDYTRERSTTSMVWEKFEALHKGLVDGSKNGKGEHKGTELIAGKAGSEAVAVFFDWWNNLPLSRRAEIGALKANYDSSYGGGLSGEKTIGQLLEQMSSPTLSAQQSALTCLDIISKHLKFILDKNIATFEQHVAIKETKELESLQDQALVEIEQPMAGYVVYDSPLGMNQLLDAKKIPTLNELISLKLITAIEMSNVATAQVIFLNHPELIKQLSIAKKVRSNAHSFLMRAVINNSLATLKWFIELCPDVLNAPINTDGDTPLISAAFNGRIEMVRYLLSHQQIAVFARNNQGETALQCAEQSAHTEIISLLKTGEETAFNQLIAQPDGDKPESKMEVIEEDPEHAKQLGNKLLEICPDSLKANPRLIEALLALRCSKMLTYTNFNALCGKAQYVEGLTSCLVDLQAAEMLKQNNFTALLAQAQHAAGLASCFTNLLGVEMLTQDNVTRLLAQAQHAAGLASCLAHLPAGMLTRENFRLLMKEAAGAASVARDLSALQAAGILTQANINMVLGKTWHSFFSGSKYRPGLGLALAYLQSKKALASTNFIRVRQAYLADGLDRCLANLQAAGMLNQANVMALINKAQAQYADGLADCLLTLRMAGMGMLTRGNFHLLLKEASDAVSVAKDLSALKDTGILTQANINMVFGKTWHSFFSGSKYRPGLGQALAYLQQAKALTSANCTRVVAQAQHAAKLNGVFSCLQQANLLTAENANVVLSHVAHIANIKSQLLALTTGYGTSRLNQKSFKAAVEQAERYVAQPLILPANIVNAYLSDEVEVKRSTPRNSFNLLPASGFSVSPPSGGSKMERESKQESKSEYVSPEITLSPSTFFQGTSSSSSASQADILPTSIITPKMSTVRI